ncbi:hypothetical protein ALISP_4175 [Alicycliphilus sp. B1]|nr:hypothetical protein ALISP_4175 [Alicycliphilus sp. B1]
MHKLLRWASVAWMLAMSGIAHACPDCQDNRCVPFIGCACIPRIGCSIPIPIPGTTGSPNEIPSPIPGAGIPSPVPIPTIGADALKAADKGITDIGKTVEKAVRDVGANLSKANEDVKAEATRAGQNVEEAGRAIVKYVERQVQSTGQTLTNAERRLREGKVVDALWHLGIEPMQANENNAAAAAQESELLRTVGSAAASAYGGPGGAAAYAAWLTYKQTGDANLALRVGILTGASGAAFGAASEMPSGTSYELAKKTVVTGAIGGLAVAAAGGNEEAIKAGFLSAGAMVLVQDGYRKYTGHSLDAKSSEGDAYCMTAGEECSPPEAAMLQKDKDGNVTLDMSKVDPKRPAVGMKVDPSKVSWQSEQSPFMTSVSRIPGMQAMAIFHDTWTMGWESDLLVKATIVPAVVLTYTGTGAPYYDLVRRTTIDTAVAEKYPSKAQSGGTPDQAGGVIQPGDSNPQKLAKDGAAFVRNTSNITTSFLCGLGQDQRQIYVDVGRRKKDGPVCRVGYRRSEGYAELHYGLQSVKSCESKAAQIAKSAVDAGWICAASTKAVQTARAKKLKEERQKKQS